MHIGIFLLPLPAPALYSDLQCMILQALMICIAVQKDWSYLVISEDIVARFSMTVPKCTNLDTSKYIVIQFVMTIPKSEEWVFVYV